MTARTRNGNISVQLHGCPFGGAIGAPAGGVLARVNFAGGAGGTSLDDGAPRLTTHMVGEHTESAEEIWVSTLPVTAGVAGEAVFAEDGEHLFYAVRLDARPVYRDAVRRMYETALEFTFERGYTEMARMWNLVGGITDPNADGVEIYQDFCVGRAEAFAAWDDRVGRLPAATGIGTLSQGVDLCFIAVRPGRTTHIENPRQTPAYKYPARYGPKSPSFARATWLRGLGDEPGTLFVSGTASIVGAETVHVGDTAGQVDETLRNIEVLIGEENLAGYGVDRGFELKDLNRIRVYVRDAEDLPLVRERVRAAFPAHTEIAWFNVDVCRTAALGPAPPLSAYPPRKPVIRVGRSPQDWAGPPHPADGGGGPRHGSRAGIRRLRAVRPKGGGLYGAHRAANMDVDQPTLSLTYSPHAAGCAALCSLGRRAPCATGPNRCGRGCRAGPCPARSLYPESIAPVYSPVLVSLYKSPFSQRSARSHPRSINKRTGVANSTLTPCWRSSRLRHRPPRTHRELRADLAGGTDNRMKKSHSNSARMRRAATLGIVTATALAAVSGMAAPPTAVAAAAGSAAAAAGIGTTDKQRVDAAAVVRLDPTPDVLLLGDHDFIHTIWQKARDNGEPFESVRLAAETAMTSEADEDHVRFIATGIHEAYAVDKQREKDKADAARAARLAKSQALIALGIASSPDLLGLSDDNFIRAVLRHEAAGPEVRAAAAQALAADAAAWQEFIANGARDAHQRDVAAEIKELEEKNRAEAERRKEVAARTNAAALFRITPSEALLALGDDNFIRELLRTAPADARESELYAAAQRAVLDPDPAAWKEFIHTGAEAAYKKDDEARRKKIAEADRRLALQIQAAAENTGVNPNLVAAAKKALAGSDQDVARFLKEDSQYRAKRQSLQPANGKPAGFFVRQSDVDAGEAFLAPVSADSRQTDREDATWVVVPSLGGKPGCYSLESARKPGHYLAQKGLRVRMIAGDGSAQFGKDATWCARKGLGGSGTSFESASQPGRFLRQHRGDLYAADKSAKNAFDAERDFAQEASWKIAAPLAR